MLVEAIEAMLEVQAIKDMSSGALDVEEVLRRNDTPKTMKGKAIALEVAFIAPPKVSIPAIVGLALWLMVGDAATWFSSLWWFGCLGSMWRVVWLP